MAELTVDIVTPEKLVYSGPASEIRVPGWHGEFGVLPGHTAFLSLLRGGVTVVQTPGGAKRFITGRGFAEAGTERVVVLTDRCESGDGIDKAEAQRAMAEAVRVIGDTAAGSEERLRAEQELELARARMAW